MCNTEDCLHYDYVRLAWDIGFTFEEYDLKNGFDISVIGLVDVEKVAKERDIPTVVKHIPTLLNFRLDNELSKVLEPNFIKLFRLSQLAIQYLIFCKKYLDSTVALIKNELVAINEEKTDVEAFLEELKAENSVIKRKYEELKATLSTSTFKCEECSKTFYSEEYLLAHIRRRHQVHNVEMQTEADKLQLEITELKQRLNNTERLILKEESKQVSNILIEEKSDCNLKLSPKESEGDKEKELESVEPNNDDIIDNSIQFKFEQLKNHIETEINSLKNEDFYAGICEKFIKEQVEKTLSGTSVLNHSKETLQKVSTQDVGIQHESTNLPSKEDNNSVLEPNGLDNSIQISDEQKGIEICTQTDFDKNPREGTGGNPEPNQKQSLERNDDDNRPPNNLESRRLSTGGRPSSRLASSYEGSLVTDSKETSQVVIKTIEEKLAKEAEHQRETLEHILDLKLSGSLNKMETQMIAFWQKLNAWECNLSAKSNSAPSVNVHSEPVKNVTENGKHSFRRQNSAGSIVSNSPIHNNVPHELNVHKISKVQSADHPRTTEIAPKALPRSFPSKPPTIVAPRTIEIKNKIHDVSHFLDTTDDEIIDEVEPSEASKIESKSKSVTETSDEETPSNIKPTESFKKHLDKTLQPRLKPPKKIQTAELQTKSSSLGKLLAKTSPSKSTSQERISSKLTSKHNEINEDMHSSYSDDKSQKSISESTDTGSLSEYEHMRKRLKRHVEETVSQKLKDIGVSPHWKCLPEKSYNKAMEIVEHHANLSKRNIHDYHKIRKNIEKAIDKEIDKSNDEKKRNAAVLIPIDKSKQKTIKIIPRIASPTESFAPSEISVDIPLQRISGHPSIKQNDWTSQHQSNSSAPTPVKPKVNQVTNLRANRNAELGSIATLSPVSKQELSPNANSSGTIAIAEDIPSNQRKKVLFNLDCDSDQSGLKSPAKVLQIDHSHNKPALSTFVEQEKSKLHIDKHGKTKKIDNLELHTGSESSDWDISDIT